MEITIEINEQNKDSKSLIAYLKSLSYVEILQDRKKLNSIKILKHQ